MIKLDRKPFYSFRGSLSKLDASGKSRDVVAPIMRMKRDLEARAIHYMRNRRSLENVGVVANFSNISSELKSCYEGMPAPLRDELDDFRVKVLSKIRRCPYCLISEPYTNDHYLPKEIYPEFSFLSCNLIPCCGWCNGKKGTRVVENGKRLYFNPYFDYLPNDFLGVDVSLSELYVSFHLLKEDEVVSTHVEKLGLIERYNFQGVSVITYVIEMMQMDEDLRDTEYFKREMRRERIKSESKFGVNHYEALIYKKLEELGPMA
ncbi:HNH endonuclease signature motif containing protein [Cobetia sp. 29-18-1]|jgi:hypothetical protein|uniref:HNH endonuclease signature motif containing protein n=1 Tax=Cobetia sp. 29-18-1 TaxID=3040018 RepID=UPI002446A5ED|nr:HNH endonuclease signature motif containing protein [Cobetia sp. 29-18-1]MBR9753344.1 HNH endonuclease [Gammaproteobacteria bacterium]MDH2299727.1 HNH endonuclease signature motif containing protein [Cobetia sp. 29-18-1]